ncbi:hypothetical protein FNF27_01155 [Cafeteria roenbergensis]|uniref:Aminopeptidase P N-terminal domain-containing protein n=1 Tax=Cafeteria roenbergensis TaxID=33653 RepID=A0A5A8EL29_CAFRO|nr:hypothetical protein FNF27_01155 [Cafeteria roenbergensis]
MAVARLTKLREILQSRSLAAFVCPTDDAHLSEYVADCDMRRAFISGFTGSAGTAVVTLDTALLWTDGRYFAQAAAELDPECWTLMKDRLPATPSIDAWLADNLASGATVGVDPRTVADSTASAWSATLSKAGMSLLAVEDNPVDAVWDARPPAKVPRVQVQPLAVAGATVEDKLERVREALRKQKANALVVAALDEVAWLLNLRGVGAIAYNPVFPAYCLVTETGATLFTDMAAPDTAEAREGTAAAAAFATGGDKPPHATPLEHLAAAGVSVRPYEEVDEALAELGGTAAPSGTEQPAAAAAAGTAAGAPAAKVLLDPASCNMRLGQVAGPRAIRGKSPIPLLKATKTEPEISGFRTAHARDALAVCRAFSAVETAVAAHEAGSGPALDEWGVTQIFLRERSALRGFQDLSFGTIAGSGGNGAVIHYSPPEAGSAPVGRDRMLLVDSGGQYVDGTTDITRTVHMGAPTDWQRRCFTRVLQGHIGLATAVFPEGTAGALLDSFARRPLWTEGLNYAHGTGHGVGSFLNVHEGPHGISPRVGALGTGIVPSMTVTDEPGYYEGSDRGAEGFGIRIEDVLVVRSASTGSPEAPFCRFETFDVVPISPKLVDTSVMTAEERDWLNAYNARVRAELVPQLERSIEAVAAGGAPAGAAEGKGDHITEATERATLAWVMAETEAV